MALVMSVPGIRCCYLYPFSRRKGGISTPRSLPVLHSASNSAPTSSSYHHHATPVIVKHRRLKRRAMLFGGGGGDDSPANAITGNAEKDPDHLLILVHGLIAGPSDWTFIETELSRRLGSNFLIHVSSSNSYAKTLSGIDVGGKRLASEVREVAEKRKNLKRISFLSHSLGGLFARYAVAVLFDPSGGEKSIAGLEAVSFITLASPHLGVRGRKQLPFLFGVALLEKLALPLAPIIAGRTGNQLFLNDDRPDKPPLLLRMARDSPELRFLSALDAFRCRTVYANVSYDHIVGWRTSSIRRDSELVEPSGSSLDGYKHVVSVEYCPPVLSQGARFSPRAVKAKEAAQTAPTVHHTLQYHEMMEEEMIRGLQCLGWRKVDVSFHSAPLPFLAHNNIHVKNEFLNSAGVGVVTHVADCISEQECRFPLTASL